MFLHDSTALRKLGEDLVKEVRIFIKSSLGFNFKICSRNLIIRE